MEGRLTEYQEKDTEVGLCCDGMHVRHVTLWREAALHAVEGRLREYQEKDTEVGVVLKFQRSFSMSHQLVSWRNMLDSL